MDERDREDIRRAMDWFDGLPQSGRDHALWSMFFELFNGEILSMRSKEDIKCIREDDKESGNLRSDVEYEAPYYDSCGDALWEGE